ncbi:hypothetical protein LTR78_009261 [Recurvomyces mirabilis]|uniref:Methyltransferase type 11 domain-containing protein n=1 Tax=Recurvomyces mirabilis TaxID=574656 RepID=A0AAE0TNU5_9PEZI|nr:hypothetical protein LTR78_009261 [Recurvomyces mirabilis]KAK5156178.1 hypothetical protein LTS14_005065 [Recurvomyces mirabilis]
MSVTFNPYSQDDEFWATYLKGRPLIPDSFFNLIYDYHTSNGGSFVTVHDAGAGAGVQSTQLSKRFRHVLLSDPPEENMAVAQRKLASEQFSFRLAKLENINDIEFKSIDMVHCGTMLHWTEIDKALDAVAHQLKPGGTFAAYTCAVPTMNDPYINSLWKKIIHQGPADMALKLPRDPSGWQLMLRAGETVGSAYDSVPLPNKYFHPGAQRMRMNWPKGWDWHDYMVHEDLRNEWKYVSAIKEHDLVVSQSSPGWELKTNLQGLHDTLASLKFDLATPEMKTLVHELEEAVEQRTVEGVWPVTLLLATRK